MIGRSYAARRTSTVTVGGRAGGDRDGLARRLGVSVRYLRSTVCRTGATETQVAAWRERLALTP